jgi:hypothetical protein
MCLHNKKTTAAPLVQEGVDIEAGGLGAVRNVVCNVKANAA